MKRYVSHKEVDAGKITNILPPDLNTSMQALVIEGDDNTIFVSREWLAKHSDEGKKDLIGGYVVQYADGYTSWSPADAFEQGYTLIDTDPQPGVEDVQTGKGFDVALKALKAGFKAHREGWNGKNLLVEMQTPDANSKMSSSYLYIRNTEIDGCVPWSPSQTDLFATDWVITK